MRFGPISTSQEASTGNPRTTSWLRPLSAPDRDRRPAIHDAAAAAIPIRFWWTTGLFLGSIFTPAFWYRLSTASSRAASYTRKTSRQPSACAFASDARLARVAPDATPIAIVGIAAKSIAVALSGLRIWPQYLGVPGRGA